MLRRVWVDDWQMQCCGDPFRIGERVTFTTRSIVDRAFLGRVLGEDLAAEVTDSEDHHEMAVGPTATLTGRVAQIDAVYCRYELQGRVLHPVAGTTSIEPRDEATGWEDGDTGEVDVRTGRRFVGYVVTVKAQ